MNCGQGKASGSWSFNVTNDVWRSVVQAAPPFIRELSSERDFGELSRAVRAPRIRTDTKNSKSRPLLIYKRRSALIISRLHPLMLAAGCDEGNDGAVLVDRNMLPLNLAIQRFGGGSGPCPEPSGRRLVEGIPRQLL